MFAISIYITKSKIHNKKIKSQFASLNINKSKCEVAGTGVTKRVKLAASGVEFVDLLTKTINILVINFSYNLDHYNETSKCYKYLENTKSFTSRKNNNL